MCENSPKLEKLGRWMGHSHIGTTQKYIHAIDQSDLDTINKHSLKTPPQEKPSETKTGA